MVAIQGKKLHTLLKEYCIDVPLRKNESPKTQKKKREFFHRFTREFGNQSLITKNIIAYLEKLRRYGCHKNDNLKKPWKPSSLNTEIRMIRSFINWLFLYQHISHNFSRQVPFVIVDNRKKDMISPELALSLANKSNEIKPTDNKLVRERKNERRLYLIMLLLTGARKEELTHVTGDDLHFDVPEPYFEVLRKGRRREIMIIPPKYIDTLKNRTNWEKVFPANPEGVAKSWRESLKEHGIKKRITLHRFRHIKTTAMIDAGAKPIDVKEVMGHKGINVTLNIYRQFSTKGKSDVQRMYDPLWLKDESSETRLDLEQRRLDESGIKNDKRFTIKECRKKGKLIIEIMVSDKQAFEHQNISK